MTDYSINSRLREWMELNRYSNNDLVEWAGISRSAVSQIMRDKMNLSVETLIKIFSINKKLCPRWLLLGEAVMDSCDIYQGLDMKSMHDDNLETLKRLRNEHNTFKENTLRQIKNLEDLLQAKEDIIKLLREKNDSQTSR